MSFFNVFKALLEELGDPDFIKYMEQSLVEKERSLQKLRSEEGRLRMEQTFLTMEHYTLSTIFSQIAYRRSYQEELELQLDTLLEETLKLGNILERVEWKNLFNYNELKNAEQKQKNECFQKEMKMLFQQMESRPVAIEFRQEQKKKAKLETLLKDFNKAIANERKIWLSKINAASQRCNNVILELVISSKNLKDLRLKIANKKPENSVSKQINSVQIFKSTGRVIPSKVEGQSDKETINILENELSLGTQTDAFIKPTKSSLNIHFNVYDFEKFCFERFQLKQKDIADDTFEKYQMPNLRSIQKDTSKNKETSEKTSKRSKRHVEFAISDDIIASNENQNSFGFPENFEKEDLVKEVEKSSATFKDTPIEVMEVKILSNGNECETIKAKPIKKQKFPEVEMSMLNLETEKPISIDSEEEETKFHSMQDHMSTTPFLEPVISDTNVFTENSPENSHFISSDKEHRLSFENMFSNESEVSVDIQNEDQTRVSFF